MPAGKKRRQFKRQRLRLAEIQEWKCYYCKQTMEKPDSPSPKRLTTEHLNMRGTTARQPFLRGVRVAACWECNNRLGIEHGRALKKMRSTWKYRIFSMMRKVAKWISTI